MRTIRAPVYLSGIDISRFTSPSNFPQIKTNRREFMIFINAVYRAPGKQDDTGLIVEIKQNERKLFGVTVQRRCGGNDRKNRSYTRE